MILLLDGLFWVALLGLVLYFGHRRGFRWGAFFKMLGWWRCESRCVLGGFGCRCIRFARHFDRHRCIHGGEWHASWADHPTRVPR